MTNKERQHLNQIASLSCLICGDTRVEVHHVRRYGEKRNNFKTVPLCILHHRGSQGIHYLGKKLFERLYMTQDEMLIETEKRLK